MYQTTAPTTNSSSSYNISLPYNVTILTIETLDLAYGFSYSKVMPAIQLALTKITSLYKGRIVFNWNYRVGSCGPERVGSQAAEAYYSGGFNVFIGPGTYGTAYVSPY
jgi:hypothetical protein